MFSGKQQTITHKRVVDTSPSGSKTLFIRHVKPAERQFVTCPLLISSDPAERSQCDCSSAPPAGLSRGKLLLHCFLQGLKAGLSEGTGKFSLYLIPRTQR